MNTQTVNPRVLQSYYKWHAPLYDATRWSFLFGRNRIVQKLSPLPHKANILEVGCGTGHNLVSLRKRFPSSRIKGIDCSKKMLGIASKKDVGSKTKLLQHVYGDHNTVKEKFDLILLSYSLTMMHQPVEKCIKQLKTDLKETGIVAVVDFHATKFAWFRHWMKQNHVNMDNKLLQSLKNRLNPVNVEVKPAYWGCWSYFLFIGTKR